MNEEILKLAEEMRIRYIVDDKTLESFYRAAYNKAIEDAAGICERFGDREMHPYECEDAIRALEMK